MAARENRDSRPDGIAYSLDAEDLPVYIGKGSGNLYYEDAIELSMLRRRARGLPYDREFVSLGVPRPKRWRMGSRSLHAPRASRNNPYICDHCTYRTTRYGNMKKHLENVHNDITTDPKQSQ